MIFYIFFAVLLCICAGMVFFLVMLAKALKDLMDTNLALRKKNHELFETNQHYLKLQNEHTLVINQKMQENIEDKNKTIDLVNNALVLQTENVTLKQKQEEYRQAFVLLHDVLLEKSTFLRSEFIRRFGMNIPELNEINSQIHDFENALTVALQSLKEAQLAE